MHLSRCMCGLALALALAFASPLGTLGQDVGTSEAASIDQVPQLDLCVDAQYVGAYVHAVPRSALTFVTVPSAQI
jgi:hypothetical protein